MGAIAHNADVPLDAIDPRPRTPRHTSLSEKGTTRLILASQCTVDFETFQRVLNRPGGFRDPGEPDEYCRGFQVFDKDMTGFIGVGQLKYILTNLGEKMTDEEVDELLKAVDTSSGQVNYTGTCPTIPVCPSTYVCLVRRDG